MTVLYISSRSSINISEASRWFQQYCEGSDLHLHTDPKSAKDFLRKNVIEENKHLDFIITDWKFNLENIKPLLSWLRESEETYSEKNFLFRSIPVLLIEDTIDQSSSISDGFDGVVKDFPNNHSRLNIEIKKAIRNWRSLLADDLDLIGLDPKTQKIYPRHRSYFISYYKLKVLSKHFVDNKSKKLNYIWTNPEINPFENSNEIFEKMIKETTNNPKKYPEKTIHNFFRENPTFIKGEHFISTQEEMLYEKHFYKDGTRSYIEPDFINKPHEYALRFPEIFEIKLQSQKILHYQKERFISKAKKSFNQVYRYKAYMSSGNPKNQYYIKHYLGKIYSSYEYTLLMGSMNEKQEHKSLIEDLKSDFEFDDINLITYEELLERHIRLCDRLSNFNIF